jgi:hypothetical protein
MGVIGHSFGGNVALFLAALDARVAYACASGAIGSYRQKMAAGTALEGALIIPGFAGQYDLDDLLRCVSPRKLLVVSSDDDPLSSDAEELVQKARPAFELQGCTGHLQHLRTDGPHALDHSRFKAIVEWTVQHAPSP